MNAMAAEIHRRRCIYVDGGMETAHRRKTAAERENGGKKLLHSARPTGSSKWEDVDDENRPGTRGAPSMNCVACVQLQSTINCVNTTSKARIDLENGVISSFYLEEILCKAA